MELEKYHLESDENQEVYDFYSQGPKGIIHKRVVYQITSEPNV